MYGAERLRSDTYGRRRQGGLPGSRASRRSRPQSTPPHPVTPSSSARATMPRALARPAPTRVTITKSLTLKGAGADLVTITPKANPLVRGSILGGHARTSATASATSSRSSARRRSRSRSTSPASRSTAMTRRAARSRSRPASCSSTPRARSSAAASRTSSPPRATTPTPAPAAGAARSPASASSQTSNALLAPVDGARKLRHRPHPRRQVQQDRHPDRRRAERHGAVHRRPARSTGASSPPARSSAAPSASTTPARATAPPSGLLTTGPLFGQDGLRVTSGSYATVDSSLISQNLVNGTGAPTRNADDQQREPDARPRASATSGAKIDRATRARPARSSTRASAPATSSTTPTACSTSPPTARPPSRATRTPSDHASARATCSIAENNWWGLRFNSPTNPGPAISPTTNPQDAGEPGQRHGDGRDGLGRDDLQRGRLLPVPQRPAVGSDQRPVPGADRADPGRRRRSDGVAAGPASANRGTTITLDRRRRPTTSASSACASPRASPRSAPPRRRRTRSA